MPPFLFFSLFSGQFPEGNTLRKNRPWLKKPVDFCADQEHDAFIGQEEEMVAIVVTRSASMPSSCMGRYEYSAVVDVPYWKAWNKRWKPAMVSEHCRDVYRVIWTSAPGNVGKTEKCAAFRNKARAEEIAQQWNNARDMASAEQIVGAGGSA